jgi:transposase
LDVFCGIDWAEDHHDVALVDRDGGLLARLRITDDAAGLALLLELLAGHGDSPEDPVPVAIETPRGLLVSAYEVACRARYGLACRDGLAGTPLARPFSFCVTPVGSGAG